MVLLVGLSALSFNKIPAFTSDIQVHGINVHMQSVIRLLSTHHVITVTQPKVYFSFFRTVSFFHYRLKTFLFGKSFPL